ncbi:MAG: 2-C-methyl-D-erythritol 4-phosphate cytidylyltransferase [Zetaproteobacteria bacterium CG1_02_55_237]|nr:MAG: 2-C-methyl-D-erythritol 4-phosphate cytidylyltransferase [Zetaproteobacteria bacterium CG1_02_55_237]
MRVGVLFLAAGSGRRFGGDIPKQYERINGLTLVELGLRHLAAEARIAWLQPVLAEGDNRFAACLAAQSLPYTVLPAVTGGAERSISMSRGLAALPAECDWVAVQDAARPIPSPTLLAAVLDAAQEHGAAVPGMDVHDTIKQVDEKGMVVATLDRSVLRAVQTPQVARRSSFEEALARFSGELQHFTDDASLLEAAGYPVFISPGEAANRKITTRQDMDWLRRHWEEVA